MKKRAVLFLLVAIVQIGIPLATVYCQDTIIAGKFTSSESFKTMTESWKIMEQSLVEQLKSLGINPDSLKYYRELLSEQVKNLPDPLVVPDDIAMNYGDNFNRDVFTTTVSLKGESKTKEIFVNVEKEIPVMFLIVDGGVRSGIISVGIYNPNGKKKGGFSIKNDERDKSEIVNGSINESFKIPMKGKWKVRVDSENAHGEVYIKSIQKL